MSLRIVFMRHGMPVLAGDDPCLLPNGEQQVQNTALQLVIKQAFLDESGLAAQKFVHASPSARAQGSAQIAIEVLNTLVNGRVNADNLDSNTSKFPESNKDNRLVLTASDEQLSAFLAEVKGKDGLHIVASHDAPIEKMIAQLTGQSGMTPKHGQAYVVDVDDAGKSTVHKLDAPELC